MNITVYCGTSTGNNTGYQEQAAKLGLWIVRNHHTLVYGGGNIGLMGVIAEKVFSNGGHVIGVLPENIDMITSRPQPYCSELILEPDMASRKVKLMEMADAFIALPGGIGTLDEITEIMTLIKIDIVKKPAVLFNIHQYYEPFRTMLDHMINCGFMNPEDLSHILFSDNLNEIEQFLSTF